MRFKVGDKVRVREDLELGKYYGNQYFNLSMTASKGKVVTINKVFRKDYELKDIIGFFTDEMLEPVEEKEPEQHKKEDENYCYGISGNFSNPGHGQNTPGKRVIKNIIRFEEKNCDNCKHYNNGMGLVLGNPCYKCMDFDKWEEKKDIPIPESYTKTDKFKALQKQELELYKLKNAKYGDSFGISVKKYGLISALTRMSDKFNRIETLILNHDGGTDDESLIDSLQDLSNYANMTIVELEDNPCN